MIIMVKESLSLMTAGIKELNGLFYLPRKKNDFLLDTKLLLSALIKT